MSNQSQLIDLLQGEDPIARVLLANLQAIRGYDLSECMALAPPELSQHDLMRLLILVRQIQKSPYPKQLTDLHRSPFVQWADSTNPWRPTHYTCYQPDEVWVGWIHNPYLDPPAPPLNAEEAESLWHELTQGDKPAHTLFTQTQQATQLFYLVWRVNSELVIGSSTIQVLASGQTCALVIQAISTMAVRELGHPIEFRQVKLEQIRKERPPSDDVSTQIRRLPHTTAGYDWIP